MRSDYILLGTLVGAFLGALFVPYDIPLLGFQYQLISVSQVSVWVNGPKGDSNLAGLIGLMVHPHWPLYVGQMLGGGLIGAKVGQQVDPPRRRA